VATDIGLQKEKVVVVLLKELISQQYRFCHNHLVVDYVHAHKSDSNDQAGIDILIIFNTGFSMPLQVGSRSKKLNEHLKKYPHVHFVFIIDKLPVSKNSKRQIRRRLCLEINTAIASAYQPRFTR